MHDIGFPASMNLSFSSACTPGPSPSSKRPTHAFPATRLRTNRCLLGAVSFFAHTEETALPEEAAFPCVEETALLQAAAPALLPALLGSPLGFPELAPGFDFAEKHNEVPKTATRNQEKIKETRREAGEICLKTRGTVVYASKNPQHAKQLWSDVLHD